LTINGNTFLLVPVDKIPPLAEAHIVWNT
jgi:hypothetical protein